MATIPGLSVTPVAWWKASDAPTLEIDASGNVRRWFDKSGNGRHLFTSDVSAARRPKYYAADERVGGRPSVAATAANQLLQTALEGSDGTPVSYALEVREIYAVTMYSTGTQTNFNVANNVAGWGAGAVAGSNDGYSALVGGVVNGATGGNPRFMGNLNTGRVIGTNALAVEGAYRNRDTFPSGSGDTGKPILLPLPLSLLRIAVTSTAISAARVIGNMDVGSSRAWSGPILELVLFDQPLSEADRKVMQDYALYGYGIEPAPSAPIAGTLAKTLGALTVASTGRLALRGALARPLGALSTVSAAKLDLRGRGAGALRPATLASNGRVSARGAAVIALGSLTLVARSPSQGRGEARIILGDASASARGRSDRRGVAAIGLGDLGTISAGRAQSGSKGRVSGQLADLRSQATGRLTIRGRTASVLADLAASATAGVAIAARAAISLGTLILGATGRRIIAAKTPATRTVRVPRQSRLARVASEKRVVKVAAKGIAMTTLTWPYKDPDDILDYAIDWSEWLAGDEIVSSVWIVGTGLIASREAHTATQAGLWLAGGELSRVYEIVNRITTAAGRSRDQTVRLSVSSR